MSANRRRSCWLSIAAVAAMITPALGHASPAVAAHRYVATARQHAVHSAHAAVRASVSATGTATAGTPPMRATATVRVTATGAGRATRGAWATARRTAATRAQARRAAREAARAAARRSAQRQAAAVAHTRALAAARASAQAQADVAARRAAEEKARTLAGLAPAPASDACATLPKSGGGQWTCTFDDEFNGTTLSAANWMPLTTAGTSLAGGTACLMDSPDNIRVGGGVLSLTVRKTAQPFTCYLQSGSFTTSYTGGQVGTYGKFAQTYGRFAVRAKFPATAIAGLQSSLWMWPLDTGTSLHGEIDIAEEYSQYADRVIPYLHYAYDPATVQVASTNPVVGTNVVTNDHYLVPNVNAFHEYAVEWTASTITIFIDGRTVLQDRVTPLSASPFDQPFFLILSACLGLGTNAVDPQRTPLPATTQIDWVRAWK